MYWTLYVIFGLMFLAGTALFWRYAARDHEDAETRSEAAKGG